MKPTGTLSAELFARGEDAYLDVANDLVRDPVRRPPIRRIVDLAGQGLMTDVLWKAGVRERKARKWMPDLQESYYSAYIFAVSESWNEVDRNRAVQLINEGLSGVKAYREDIGADPISLQNVDHRITYTMIGTQGSLSFWDGFKQYLASQPSFQRIMALRPLYAAVAEWLTKEKDPRFQKLDELAWKTGIVVGFLDILGELPEEPLRV